LVHRSIRFRAAVAAVLAGVCLLAACGKSSSDGSATTKTIGNSVPLSAPPTTPLVPIAPAACSLVNPAQIKKLLGATGVPVEANQGVGNKSCVWTAAPPAAGGSASKVYLGLIRIGNGQAGFGTTVSELTPTVVQGVGDTATYSSGRNTKGLEDRLLVTKKGTVSMSINVIYGSGSKPPASVKADILATAKRTFVKVHA
jgi:hypothetical protein